MKTNILTQIVLRKTLMMLSCLFCFNSAIAQSTYYFHPDQKLIGHNNNLISYRSNSNDKSNLAFFDKDGTRYGDVIGTGNGARFGLMDGDGDWSFFTQKDNYTAFLINNDEKLRIKNDGNVGIGTANPQHKLEVCGVIRAKEVLVEDSWCDFVFEPEYCLTTLEDEAEFIELYGHLSNFESAKDMNGEINVNEIFKRQQIQLEENVLHLIELNEENEVLQIQVAGLVGEVGQLTDQVNTLMANYQVLAKQLAVIKKQLP